MDAFRGSTQDWKDWSFQVRTITKSVDADFAEFLEEVEKQGEYDKEQAMKDSADVDPEDNDIDQAAREFYNVLCTLCAGEALMIVRNVVDGDGGSAWFELKRRDYSNTIATTLRKFMGVVATTRVEMKSLGGALGDGNKVFVKLKETWPRSSRP